jgi:D-3-phosphoglycerate dehydrogenase
MIQHGSSRNQTVTLSAMADIVVDALVIDLLEWLAARERSYEEVMDAWRTSCPRLPIWEDANDLGLVTRQEINGRNTVHVSPSGRALLDRRKPHHSEGLTETN